MDPRDTALVALYAAIGGLFSLAYALHAATGCTQMACGTYGSPALRRVSFAHWHVYWYDGCNGCFTDLTPVLAGVGLLAVAGCLVAVAGGGLYRRRTATADG